MKSLFPTKRNICYSDLLRIARTIAGPNASLYLFDPNAKVVFDIDEVPTPDESIAIPVLVNLGQELIQYKNLPLDYFNFILDFGKKIQINPTFEERNLTLYTETNGRIKWIRERKSRHNVLRFFQKNSVRSKLIGGILTAAITTGLDRLFFYNAKLLNNTNFHFDRINTLELQHFAINLGSPGPFQKSTVFVQYPTHNSYLKVAVCQFGKKRIGDELFHMKRLRALGVSNVNYANFDKNSTPYILETENILNPKSTSFKKLNDFHINGILDLFQSNLQFQRFSNTSFYSDILDHLNVIKQKRPEELNKMFNLLKGLKTTINRNEYIFTGVIHGDFTPWNAYVTNQKLDLIDWESTRFDGPALYDLFHFLFQSELFITKKSPKQTAKKIRELLTHSQLDKFIKQYDLNIEFYYQLFLLHHVSKLSAEISLKKKITAKDLTTIQVCEYAIAQIATTNQETKDRSEFLSELQEAISGKEYVWLKAKSSDFATISSSSDLDLACDQNTSLYIQNLVKHHPRIKHVKSIQKSFMTTCNITFINNEFLSIDLIHKFQRKQYEYCDIKSFLTHKKTHSNGVQTPSILHDFEYILKFYFLNGTDIPPHYVQSYLKQIQEHHLTANLKRYLTKIVDYSGGSIQEAISYSPLKQKKLIAGIKQKTNFFKTALNTLKYLHDIWLEFSLNKGEIITFSGVDGAGKTTVLTSVKENLTQIYRKQVVVLRHRPGILPILSTIKHGSSVKAEEYASITQPRTGTNKSKISSTLRFAYYFTDYILGQLYVKIKYNWRGITVIYDRYYFDFINDSKRSNINLNRGIVKWLYRFINKPHYNFFLYHNAEVILSRKQELNKADIVYLNEKYHELFHEFAHQYKGEYYPLKNEDLNHSVDFILTRINKAA